MDGFEIGDFTLKRIKLNVSRSHNAERIRKCSNQGSLNLFGRKTRAGNSLGSITSRCSGKEPALLPRTLSGNLGEERRPDSRKRRKSSLGSHVMVGTSLCSKNLRFQNLFNPHENEKPAFSNSSSVKSVFKSPKVQKLV